MKKIILVIAAVLAFAPHLRAEVPTPPDFGFGLKIETDPGEAFYEIRLSESVYAHIAQEDFGDIRVFNAENEVVPHILIHDEEKTVERPPPVDLPVFPIFGTTGTNRPERISARVSVDGALVEIDGLAGKTPETVTGYVIDAGGLEREPDRLALKITGDGKNYMFSVDIYSGFDLTQWRLAASNLGVANLSFGGKTLARNTVKIGGFAGKYLKIPWPPEAGGHALSGVRAFFPAAVSDEERRITSLGKGRKDESGRGFLMFESPGFLPADRAELVFHRENSMAVVQIQCGNAYEKGSWRTFREALVYHLTTGGTSLKSGPMEIPVSPYRHWRVSLDGQSVGAGNSLPELRLGWRPHKLVFVGRGSGPFLLAFGSSRVDHPGEEMRMLMDPLLNIENGKSPGRLAKRAKLDGKLIELGGEAALSTRKSPANWKKYALYFGIFACLGFVGVMAWKLSGEIREEEEWNDPRPE